MLSPASGTRRRSRRLRSFRTWWLSKFSSRAPALYQRRRSRWRRLAQKRRERLCLVAGLDVLHVVEIVRTEELGAIDRKHKLGLRAEHLLHALGRASPFQPGPAMRKLPPSLGVARLPI